MVEIKELESKEDLVNQLQMLGIPPEQIKVLIDTVPKNLFGSMEVISGRGITSIRVKGVGMNGKPEQSNAPKPNGGTYIGDWKVPELLAGIAKFFGISRKKEPEQKDMDEKDGAGEDLTTENRLQNLLGHVDCIKNQQIMRMRQLKEETIKMIEFCMNRPLPEVIIWFGNPYNDKVQNPILLGDGYDPPGHLSTERIKQIMHYLRSRFAYLYLDGRPVLIHISGDPDENAHIFEELTHQCTKANQTILTSILGIPDEVLPNCTCLEERLDQAEDPDGPLPFSPKFLILNGVSFGVFDDNIGPGDDSFIYRFIMEEFKRVADEQCDMEEMTNGGRIINFGPSDHQVQMPKEMSNMFCEGCPGCEKVREFDLEALKAIHPIVFLEKILGIKVPNYIKEYMFKTSDDNGPDSGVDLAGDEEPVKCEPAE